jgi:hypothetical protein
LPLDIKSQPGQSIVTASTAPNADAAAKKTAIRRE